MKWLVVSCLWVYPLLAGSYAFGVEAKEELLSQDKVFAALSAEKGYALAFAAFLHEEAVMLPDGAEPIYGRTAIVRALEAGARERVLSWRPVDAVVSAAGDMGYTWGFFEARPKGAPADSAPVAAGKYLNVWKRDAEGTWKVLVDMGNSGGEPALPERTDPGADRPRE